VILHPSRPWMLLLAGLAVLSLAPCVAQSQELDQTATEVSATWHAYLDAFVAGRPAFIADSIFSAPMFNSTAEGLFTAASSVEVEAGFRFLIDALVADGYDRTEVLDERVCPLSDTVAILGAAYVRHRKDGSEMSRGSVTYVFMRLPTGWRITTIVDHPPERLISCNG